MSWDPSALIAIRIVSSDAFDWVREFTNRLDGGGDLARVIKEDRGTTRVTECDDDIEVISGG
ncbi:hypothetical protein PNQ29_11905 [Halobacterium salinarum]|uniref:hypothetical protein n=1 Tax=Halobacterium salinarum TaxID=2242 RepID=UPI0025550B59|nr:hypothetical protein [Halobacterium salinarum]MDL0120423.1 hypothetical protein [Halobacterium salinarum]